MLLTFPFVASIQMKYVNYTESVFIFLVFYIGFQLYYRFLCFIRMQELLAYFLRYSHGDSEKVVKRSWIESHFSVIVKTKTWIPGISSNEELLII